MEAKAFLADVFDYDYNNALHREIANKILHIVETRERDSNRAVYECERFKQFFTL